MQDDRLPPTDLDDILAQTTSHGIHHCAVNGCWQNDWQRVLDMCSSHPSTLIPNLGLHPYWVHKRSLDWLDQLQSLLQANPAAGLGECGLDKGPHSTLYAPMEEQEEVFLQQLELACRLKRPVTIHCVQAYGKVLQALTTTQLPSPAILHSYTGSKEMVKSFLALKPTMVYFSLSGHILKLPPNKAVSLVKSIPLNRLLLESDAPDACLTPLPDRWIQALPDLIRLNALDIERYSGLTTPAVVRGMVTLIAVMLSGEEKSPFEDVEEQVARATVENAERIFLPLSPQ